MDDQYFASFLSEMSDEEFEAFSDAMCCGIYYEDLMRKEENKDE